MKAEGGKADLKLRTRKYAVRIIRLYCSLPRNEVARTLGKQLLRSGTSVGAHYREGQRAKSDADLISKLEGALQELQESLYWIELLGNAKIFPPTRLQPLVLETDELLSILVTVVKNIKGR